MSAAENKAVFLSYASQDAEAARRICEALRAAGVEVWFDQNEPHDVLGAHGLVGGDAWDAKIRKQIKECALFVAVISANTQARTEGYFRLEWRLADQRTHLMAKGRPFLLPVVIDDTRDSEAHVPDSFNDVQWTLLRPATRDYGGQAHDEDTGVAGFCARVRHLLAGDAAPLNVPFRVAESAPVAPRATRNRWRLPALLGAAALVVAVLLVVWNRPTPTGVPAAAEGAETTASVASGAEAYPRDPELKNARALIYGLNGIAEDFALAEDIVKAALAARPNDPDTTTVYAEVAQEILSRGYDGSDARRALARRFTERAVQLSPHNPDALATLGRFLLFNGSQLPRAEELLRQAIELNPREARYHRTLLGVLAATKTITETDAFAARMIALFPTDPLVRYDNFRRLRTANELVRAEQALDETIALRPVAGALIWKAHFALEVHGDVAGMKTWLDRVPERQRNNRFAYARAIEALVSGEREAAIKAVSALTETWLTDFDFTGPKALLLGDLLLRDGRKDLARLQYEAALAEIQREVARNPTDLRAKRAELWTLLGLDRREDAQAGLQILLQSLPRPYRANIDSSWWTGAIRACFLLDEREQALRLLREAASDPISRQLLRNQIRVDPEMASYRDAADIRALLAEPEGTLPAGSSRNNDTSAK
jgi:tetratricopeptide (TPR) repeat protein